MKNCFPELSKSFDPLKMMGSKEPRLVPTKEQTSPNLKFIVTYRAASVGKMTSVDEVK